MTSRGHFEYFIYQRDRNLTCVIIKEGEEKQLGTWKEDPSFQFLIKGQFLFDNDEIEVSIISKSQNIQIEDDKWALKKQNILRYKAMMFSISGQLPSPNDSIKLEIRIGDQVADCFCLSIAPMTSTKSEPILSGTSRIFNRTFQEQPACSANRAEPFDTHRREEIGPEVEVSEAQNLRNAPPTEGDEGDPVRQVIVHQNFNINTGYRGPGGEESNRIINRRSRNRTTQSNP